MGNTKQTCRGRYARKRIKFELKAEPESRVYIAGTFNDWNPEEKRLKDKNKDGNYSLFVLVPKGKQEYKFIVNGQWCLDPNCVAKKKNMLGTYNSFIDVV